MLAQAGCELSSKSQMGHPQDTLEVCKKHSDFRSAIARLYVSKCGSNCSSDVSGIFVAIVRHLTYLENHRTLLRDGHDIKAVTVKVVMHGETCALFVAA